MGCGGSRLDSQGEVTPAGIRPLLRRRIEDIRRRTHGVSLKDGTSSKKVLLVDGGSEEDEINSQSDLDDSARKAGECSSDDSLTPKQWKENGDESKEGNPKEAKSKGENDEHVVEEDDEKEGGEICPGSPSFRVYFIDNLADDIKKDGEDGSLGRKPEIGFEGSPKDSVAREVQKKGRKRRSFKVAIPKGGQAAMKNLLTCYSSDPHNHPNLVTGKTAA